MRTYIVDGMTIYDHSDEVVIADQNLQNTRLNICNTCEYKSNDICNQCFCLLNVKISISTNTCPIGKW